MHGNSNRKSTSEHFQIELSGPENDAGKLSEMAGKVTVFNENVPHQRGHC